MVLVFAHFLAAVGAAVGVEAGIYPAESYLCLDVPVAVENPRVAICHAGAYHPALVSVILEVVEVGAEEIDGYVEVADVKLAAEGMRAHEVAKRWQNQ